jgi:hypothetical protein
MSVGAPMATPVMDRKRLANYSAPTVHFRLWIAEGSHSVPGQEWSGEKGDPSRSAQLAPPRMGCPLGAREGAGGRESKPKLLVVTPQGGSRDDEEGYQAASRICRTTSDPSIFRGFVCNHRSCIEWRAIRSS